MVLVLVEHDRGTLNEMSLQGLALARSLAGELGAAAEAVLVGEAGHGLAPSLGAYGASKVHLVHHDVLSDYGPEAYAESLVQLIGTTSPVAAVATGTDRGNEVMAHVAARMDLPMVANVTEVTPGEPWEMTRVRWGGSLLERASLEAPITLMTVAPHAVEAVTVDGAAPDTAVFEPDLSEDLTRTRIVDRVPAEAGITLTTAPVVVSGGRGMGSPEAFAILEELAGLVGGAVGCSRVATNNGWRPHSDQVGQTGTRVAPELYIACGISGAIQHWVGMMASKNVLAINTDAEAPMVTKADYAVVGDVHEVLPAIIEEVKKLKG